MSDEDANLRDAMRALREHDAEAAPSFARTRAAAERRATRRRRRAIVTGALALAAGVLCAIWIARPREPLGPAPSFAGTEPLAFLLEPPAGSVTALASAERSW